MKYSLLGLGLAVIVSFGVGLWLLFGAPQNTKTTSFAGGAPALRSEAGEIESGRTSLSALLARGESRECTLFFDNGTFQGEGTAFVLPETLRVDAFYAVPSGGQFVTSIIVYQGQVYVWYTSPDGQGGFTYPLPSVTDFQADIPPGYPGILLNDLVRYTCWPWEGEKALFVPPETVPFVAIPN